MRRIQQLVGKKSKIEDVSFTAPKNIPATNLPPRISSKINSLGFNINQEKTTDENDYLMLESKEFV